MDNTFISETDHRNTHVCQNLVQDRYTGKDVELNSRYAFGITIRERRILFQTGKSDALEAYTELLG